MRPVSVWTDLYANTLALYAGRAGGHRWLVATHPEHARTAAQVLSDLGAKGETVLLVYAGPTPLESALREQNDPVLGRGLAGVLVLERDLAGGPAVNIPQTQEVAEPGGLHYRQGGHYPAWTDALSETRAPGRARGYDERAGYGESAAASVCAALGLPVRVCSPGRLRETLLEWWAATPHALATG